MLSKVCLMFVLVAVAHSFPAPGIYGESAISYTSLPVQQKQLISYAQPQLQTVAIQKSQPLLTQISHPAPQLIQKQILQPQIIQAAPQIIQAAPQIIQAAPKIEVESYDPNPQYSYKYGVTDPHTGDSKSAEESLVNGVVHGSYTLAEADGSIRKVTYTADKINGFNAVVERSGGQKQVALVAQPTITKVLQPALTKIVSAPQLSYGGYHH